MTFVFQTWEHLVSIHTQLPASEEFLSSPSVAKNISGQAFWLKFVSSLFFHGFIHQVFAGSLLCLGASLGVEDRHRAFSGQVTFSDGMPSMTLCAGGPEAWRVQSWLRAAWRTCH